MSPGPETAISPLVQPLRLRSREAPTRFLFGPMVTNMARRQTYSERHAAFYAARSRGGAGVIVVETPSIHVSDQPYERMPLTWAPGFDESLRSLAGAVRAAGPALLIAGLGHTGGQATSTFTQRPVLAPSAFPEVATREMAKEAEPEEIEEIIAGFADGAARAARAGLDGVELNAGQYALARQFLSGLTNTRTDEWGGDAERRMVFLFRLVTAARAALGESLVLGVRLSVDEFAPWAGITPDTGVEIAGRLASTGAIDYLVVTRGGPYSVNRTQPGGFIADPIDESVIARVRTLIPVTVAVFAQGGIVDVDAADQILTSGTADGVEMTRALIADPDLPAAVRGGGIESIRPCLLCNEDCQVRTNANLVLSCLHNPAAGHEGSAEFAGDVLPGPRRRVCVVGAGPAGLEAALGAASLGHAVELWDEGDAPGGAVRLLAASRPRERYARAIDWRVSRLRALGVEVRTGRRATLDDLVALEADRVAIATGGRPRGALSAGLGSDGPAVFSHRDVLTARRSPELRAALTGGGAVVVLDLADDVAGISVLDVLVSEVGIGPLRLVTGAHFVGGAYLAAGGLPDFRQRLHAAGVVAWTDHELVRAEGRRLVFRHAYNVGEASIDDVAVVVVCERDVPNDDLYLAARAAGLPVDRIGDAVAPRRILDAVLEGARWARSLGDARPRPGLAPEAGPVPEAVR